MSIPLELPRAKPRPIALSHTPLAPWLRLAHILTAGGDVLETAPSRALPDFELVLQVSGAAWLWSGPDGGSVDIGAGDVAFLPPGFVHAWGYGPGSHIAVHFDLHAQPKLPPLRMHETGRAVSARPLPFMPTFRLTELFDPGELPPFTLALVTHVRRPEVWRERLSLLVELWGQRRTQSLGALLQTAETLTWAVRTLAEDVSALDPDDTDSRIFALIRALDTPATHGLPVRPSVNDLAVFTGMGRSTFQAAFKKTMGRGPRAYLEERRMEQAARALLETNRKVMEIARMAGYDDPYHFSKVFRRVMGQSPRQYRASSRTG